MSSDGPAASLEELHGRLTSRGALRVVAIRPGRFPEERDALVGVGEEDSPLIGIKYFAGRPSADLPPWIEADLPRRDEHFAAEIVKALAAMLPLGGRLMIVYGGDETERVLQRGVPAAATPLGAALLAAGCTWLKDWYFAEGGREGETKLQGNKPLDEPVRRAGLEKLHAELRAWLERAPEGDDLFARARKRAEAILAGGPVPWS